MLNKNLWPMLYLTWRKVCHRSPIIPPKEIIELAQVVQIIINKWAWRPLVVNG
jgi:hypothetical protein